MTAARDSMPPGEQTGQTINPLDCMGEMPEALMRALMYARAALIQLQQRYATLQQQHEALGEAFDARGVELEQLKAEANQQANAIEHLTQSVRDANEREAQRYQEDDQSPRFQPLREGWPNALSDPMAVNGTPSPSESVPV